MSVRQKIARFAEIVRSQGQPEPLVLWGEPEKYPQLKRAIRENRVMTLVQDPAGTKKDFGLVGFMKQKNASYLIFPKPLTNYRDRRIVGMRYDLFVQPKPAGKEMTVKDPKQRLAKSRLDPRKSRKSEAVPEPAKPKPLPTFDVTLRAVVEAETTETVAARNQKEAGAMAMRQAETRGLDLAEAKPSWRVIRARRR